MKQPQFSNPLSPSEDPAATNGGGGSISSSRNTNGSQKRRVPTPQELISHYESQGLESQEAAVRVIGDLQHMLRKVVTSGRGKKDRFTAESSRKLDTANARLAIVEMKLDSKPGFPESLAIGIASAASFRGITAVWPRVVGAAAQIWNSVRSSTSNS
ncbi:hypothetical protein Nepgr_005722 [Nepenthes gracilis]|uniref:Uncharacterized protein n=1 Tax=Nepenthes gracilis TaxID=150966 RepID=A0AAD3XGQ7_NEPGR|nr:hypothetical protein Nepgr_005722 [Nepenthes gracilis]